MLDFVAMGVFGGFGTLGLRGGLVVCCWFDTCRLVWFAVACCAV